MAKKIIVIDREYSSGGREVGKRLSEQLNIPLYDGALLLEASRRFDYGLETIKSYDERIGSRWLDNIINAGAYMTDQTMGDPVYKVFKIMEKTIVALAAEGPCIFMGRCADHVLPSPTVLSVFIYASNINDAISRAVSIDQISENQANGYIAKVNKERSRYYRLFTGKEWGDKLNYDICLNTSALGFDVCASIIKGLYLGK